jgi:hypothetical protein
VAWIVLSAVGAALAGSCETTEPPNPGSNPPPTEAEKQVKSELREVFERWLDAGAAGRMDLVLRDMTSGYKSQWLYELLDGGVHAALDWRRTLTGTPRTDLDLWIEAGKADTTGRVPRLPVSVLNLPSLHQLFLQLLSDAKLDIAKEFSGYEITEISPPVQNGVTIVVRNVQGKSEMYQLKVEGGRWMVDHHSNGPRTVR